MPLQNPSDSDSPLYFLASLGAGGLTVTFFMYLMFWVPHPDRPVPIFSDRMLVFESGPAALKLSVAIAMLGIAGFAVLNISSLIRNLRALSSFRQTDAYAQLMQTNGQSTLLAMPLALAMSVNAMFIVGLVFVPGLWSIVEYLFPLAMIAFVAIGILALKQIGEFLGRVLSQPGAFDTKAHNSFAQMLPAFALSMIGVGLAAPAAMSTVPSVVGLSFVRSTFFAVASIVYALFAAVTGLNAMLTHGTAREAGPTLMVVIPLMTVLGILALRQDHGLNGLADAHGGITDNFAFLTRLLAIQLVSLGLGPVVLLRQAYFSDFIFGTKTSPGSYALVCPGVALSVLLHFWINKGLVAAGLLDKFSTAYWGLTAIAIALQIGMIALVFRLNRQHFGRSDTAAAIPAE